MKGYEYPWSVQLLGIAQSPRDVADEPLGVEGDTLRSRRFGFELIACQTVTGFVGRSIATFVSMLGVDCIL